MTFKKCKTPLPRIEDRFVKIRRLFMRKGFFVVLAVSVVFSVSFLSPVILFSASAADTCLNCHGSADKLKTLISDDDYNMPTGEGGHG
jgi:hypothetical protein